MFWLSNFCCSRSRSSSSYHKITTTVSIFHSDIYINVQNRLYENVWSHTMLSQMLQTNVQVECAQSANVVTQKRLVAITAVSIYTTFYHNQSTIWRMGVGGENEKEKPIQRNKGSNLPGLKVGISAWNSSPTLIPLSENIYHIFNDYSQLLFIFM